MRSPERDVRLSGFTTMAVGGPARHYWRVDRTDEIADADAWARAHELPLVVLAGGSNVIIADAGVEALVVHLCTHGISHATEGGDCLVTAAAGERWDDLVVWTIQRDLAGLECLSGIPGSVGGTPIQNVGAYGQEVANTIHRVNVYDCRSGTVVTWSAADCGFSYRSSRFKTEDTGRFVVCDVTFRLRAGAPSVTYPDLLSHLRERAIETPTLGDVREAVLMVRRRKGMVLDPADSDTRSVGSFFTNPILTAAVVDRIGAQTGGRVPAYAVDENRLKVPAAWLLEQAGFNRGYGAGPVGLSSKHPLAIVNRGGATAKHVVTFAADLKRGVAERFGVSLIPEPAFVGFGDDDDVQYLLAGAA